MCICVQHPQTTRSIWTWTGIRAEDDATEPNNCFRPIHRCCLLSTHLLNEIKNKIELWFVTRVYNTYVKSYWPYQKHLGYEIVDILKIEDIINYYIRKWYAFMEKAISFWFVRLRMCDVYTGHQHQHVKWRRHRFHNHIIWLSITYFVLNDSWRT